MAMSMIRVGNGEVMRSSQKRWEYCGYNVSCDFVPFFFQSDRGMTVTILAHHFAPFSTVYDHFYSIFSVSIINKNYDFVLFALASRHRSVKV